MKKYGHNIKYGQTAYIVMRHYLAIFCTIIDKRNYLYKM